MWFENDEKEAAETRKLGVSQAKAWKSTEIKLTLYILSTYNSSFKKEMQLTMGTTSNTL